MIVDSGEVRLTTHFDSSTGQRSLRIVQADPRARISSDYVINVDETRPDYIQAVTPPGTFVISDDYGQKFIYRVDFEDYDPQTRSYGMERPD